jgi:NADH-quinone oxidoreductase subunit H
MTAGAIAIRALIVGFIVSFAVITGFAYTTLLERRLLARLQNRVGPNRAGYIPIPTRGGGERRLLGGIMQPAADAVKLFFKEDPTPGQADRVVYNLAPMLAVIPAILVLAVIPLMPGFTLFGQAFEPYFAIAPGVSVGVLFILAITSIGVYGVVLAGWGSNSKYAVMGGIRASAQMISYELALGLSLLPPIMLAGSMDLGEIVFAQRGLWFVFLQPIAAVIFYIGALAELQRAPFDLLEAEQELSSGYNVEYAGMRFGMFFMAEYMKMISLSAIAAVLFFGGFYGPIPFADQVPVIGLINITLKIVFSLAVMIWIRASLPRFRYDQLMSFGWKRLLPLALANVVITGAFIVLADQGVLEPFVGALLALF